MARKKKSGRKSGRRAVASVAMEAADFDIQTKQVLARFDRLITSLDIEITQEDLNRAKLDFDKFAGIV